MEHIAKPTKQQLDWHEMELGVLIHYCLEMYRPELPGAPSTYTSDRTARPRYKSSFR